MLVTTIIFLFSVLVGPSTGVFKKDKHHLGRHRSYSAWERSRSNRYLSGK